MDKILFYLFFLDVWLFINMCHQFRKSFFFFFLEMLTIALKALFNKPF